MKTIANVCGFLWLACLFAALAAMTAGCPHHRLLWSVQFICLWAMLASVGAVASKAMSVQKPPGR